MSTSSSPSSDCVFCHLISGHYTASIVHETSLTFAFLDISPLHFGHVLVIPKRHCKDFLELNADELADLSVVSQLVARALLSCSSLSPRPAGINIVQNIGSMAGQTVFHAHQHIVPRSSGDGLFNSWPSKAYGSDMAKEMVQEGIRAEIKKLQPK